MKSLWKKMIYSLLVFTLAVAAGCTPAAAGGQPVLSKPQIAQSEKPRIKDPITRPEDIQTLARDHTAFALDLYGALRGTEGNLFYSPYSISTALAMTYAGAKGDTADQMADVLHFTLPADRLHLAENALSLDLSGRPQQAAPDVKNPFELSIANALWGQMDYIFLPEFLDLLAQNYGAGIRVVDFAASPENARQEINRWVSDQTKERIKDLIPQGVLNEMTRLVLSNAIYFKGGWLHQFKKSATEQKPFYLLDGSSINVDMMHQSERLGYSLQDDYKAVELPYEGGGLSMLVILPDEGRFAEVEENLNPEMLGALQDTMKFGEVDLSLPKFKFESSFTLKEPLSALGMADAFDRDKADFSGMDGRRDLFISAVLHKAFVAVDENGTEAAAATAVVMELMSAMPEEPVQFRVERPFIFLIRDNQTGSVLFLGRVLNPAK